MNVAVIIPTRQAASSLPGLLAALRQQSLPPSEIIVIDSSSADGTADIAAKQGCLVEAVPLASFNHGRARNLGARRTQADALVFMTQDALPADRFFLEKLVQPVASGDAVAACARQIAREDATPLETFARAFNYPAASCRRTQADVPRLGIKAFFFSNVASAVRRDVFWAVGGFSESLIVNEDMHLCAKLLQAGHAVAYCADAEVYHSHNYTMRQQFGRYFDIGVFLTQARGELPVGVIGAEGRRFAFAQCRYLMDRGDWGWLPRSLAESAVKFLGFHCGLRQDCLPGQWKRKLSLHPFYWTD
jgi:rhamnosyltransferase